MATRPTVVTILGVLWLVIAFLMFVSSSLAFALWHSTEMGEFINEPTQLDSEFGMPLWIFRYYGLLAGVEVMVALAAGVAAVSLLRLKAWARPALQVLSWFGLAMVVSMTVLQATAFSDLWSLDFPGLSVFFVAAMLMGVAAVMATPLVLTIWALGRPEVKAAFYR